ncbi:conserved Plasmodium protein, unknown function [Plasmodium relictum]|uniref:SURP motif domain-containing protein n=1 Tax=Plasmodium relictum TaxID=85471 RepID=A0A1J1HBF4_PLARL|nr:conserved Plasmodium protein, unknown function [Plasmodium relictum]CRH00896.1 conserved Plasmodium protein, unknown function [Plasmodium relictum]
MSKRNFSKEPPPEYLNYIYNNETIKENSHSFNEENEKEKEIFTYNLPDNKKDICLPKSLREHIVIEYTAIFVNLESDIVEFYLKLDNDLLIKFPFLHVDHPLHEYYEFIKLNTTKRIIKTYPNFIPSPLKSLFEFVVELENKKVTKNEATTKILKEKQLNNLKEKKKRKNEEKDQSYSTLFMKYMESDQESDKTTKGNKEELTDSENFAEVDDLINKISTLKNESATLYIQFLIRCIENFKYLQYGSKEYEYFTKKILYNKNVSNDKSWKINPIDFLTFIFKLDEHKINFESISGDIKEDKKIEEKDNLKMIQDYRRERAKLILHGFKKK